MIVAEQCLFDVQTAGNKRSTIRTSGRRTLLTPRVSLFPYHELLHIDSHSEGALRAHGMEYKC